MQTLNRHTHPRARVLLTLLTLGIVLATTAGVLYWRRDELAGLTWRLHLGYLVLSAVMFCAALLLVVWLWARLIQALGHPLPFFTHLRYFGLSNVAKRLPGTLWYVAGRAYLYRQAGISPTRITLASGLEVIIAALSNLIVSTVFAGPHLLSYLNTHVMVGPAIAMSALFGLVLIHPRIVAFVLEKIEKRKPESLPSYAFLVSQVMLYTGVWILGGMMFYTICAAITELSPAYITFVVGVWAMSSLFSNLILFLPANLGAKEISSSLLLSTIMSIPAAIAGSVLSRVLVTAYETLWALGAIWLARLPATKNYPLEQADTPKEVWTTRP